MISIVVPVFDEAESLPLLRERLALAAPAWGDDYEVVFVDDGSEDRSLEILLEMAQRDPGRYRVVKLSRNFGHQAAVSAGLEHARGDAVVILDADLQDPPEAIVELLRKWKEGYDVVYGVRRNRKEGRAKRLGYALFYRTLARVSDIRIPLDSGDFCLLDRKVVRALRALLPERIRFVRGLRAYAGFRQVGVPYERHARAHGSPKYDLGRLMRLAMDGVFGFSTFPLRMATYLGLAISAVAFAIGVFFVVHRALNFKILGYSPEDTPGLASLAVGVYFLGGIILVFLGLLGEYVGRIYIEVKQRPSYIVEAVYPDGRDPAAPTDGPPRGGGA